MPYIKDKDRVKLETSFPETAGELNYVFTRLAHIYVESKGESYQAYNDIIGALEGAKLELYRRKIADYEDEAIERNGDV